MLSDKQKRIIQLAIILVSILLAGVFLSPLLNGSIEASGLLGGFVGFLISIAIFPGTVKGLFEEQHEKRAARIMEQHQLGFYRSLTHLTQIPFTIAMLLFVLIIVLAFLFDILKIKISSTIFQIGILCMLFLWGLSGFLITSRKEYIDKRGRRFRGGWAIFNGVIFLLMGWGSLLFLIIANIFNW